MNLTDIRTIKDVMSIYNIHFRKEFGQNFLTNISVVEDIADSCSDTPEATVLEIGPGIGVLTQELAFRYRKVIAVEIDNGLIPVLRYTLQDCPEGVVDVVHADVMKVDLGELLKPAFEAGKVSVCANLPYNITTPVLEKCILSRCFDSITVLIQKEAAERICAKAGSPDYSVFSLQMQYYTDPQIMFEVEPECFFPAPKVTSAVLHCPVRKTPPVEVVSEQALWRTVKGGFALRRKTLANSLQSAYPYSKEQLTEVIVSCGLSPTVRGEKLTLEDYARLTNALAALG